MYIEIGITFGLNLSFTALLAVVIIVIGYLLGKVIEREKKYNSIG
jgi:uncharacterized membrane protein YqgA involved in biofilm formation